MYTLVEMKMEPNQHVPRTKYVMSIAPQTFNALVLAVFKHQLLLLALK
jgi:hypothetical protein